MTIRVPHILNARLGCFNRRGCRVQLFSRQGAANWNVDSVLSRLQTRRCSLVAKVELLSHSPGRNELLCYSKALLTDARFYADWERLSKV